MKSLLRFIGRVVWWCGWPVMWLYLRDSKRTRLVLLNGNGQVLMVRGWITSSSRWSLPGGGLHEGEDPLEGMLREVQEETGLDLKLASIASLGEQHIESKGFRFYLYFFTVTIEDIPDLHLQRLEIADAAWVDISTLTPQNTEPDVLSALAVLAQNG